MDNMDKSLDEIISEKNEAAGGARRKRKRERGGGRERAYGGDRNSDVAMVGRRCFVNNLSWQTSWQDLKDHFKPCGTVVYADVRRDKATGRSMGCGIVEFESPDQALHAISSLSNSELGGRLIQVREDREDRELTGGGVGGGHMQRGGRQQQNISGTVGRRVYVGNLAWSVSWQDLKDTFKECGNVVYADVMRESSGRSKGCGIVEFEEVEEAIAAIERFNNTEIGGREIFVREDREDYEVAKQQQPPPMRMSYQPDPGMGAFAGTGCSVVVHNLPFSCTWQQLKDIFKAGPGHVIRANIVEGPNGRSKGFGTVMYGTPAEAQEAIATFNETEYEGRALSVREDRFG